MLKHTGKSRAAVLLTTAAAAAMGSLFQAYAGDILRGGATAGKTRSASESRSAVGAEAAAAAQVRAQDRLARTTRTVNDMRALQASARAVVDTSGVPNGLVTGGLDRFQPGEANFRWDGANAPVQSGNDVTITQTLQQAVLHWKSFNVGRGTHLRFDQSAGGADAAKWVAFNRVLGAQAPSQIRGKISADGQVYIINQNGVIFGGNSQVNARTLVASGLPINDNLIQRGLLNNPDAQFLFSATPLTGGTQGPTPEFQPPVSSLPDGSFGDVVVEAGAELISPTSADRVGGRIALVGANVTNAGRISTPDGQTILAAGLQVGFDAHPSSDPSLRGLDVYIGQVNYPVGGRQRRAGTAINSGLIEIDRASATLAGRDVRQLGVIESSTTTALNGRVDLLANYGARTNQNYDFRQPGVSPLFQSLSTGMVELGANSLIRILPDTQAKDRAVGTSLALPSMINIQGQSVFFGPGSTILAPNASIPRGAGAVIPRDGSRDNTLGRLAAGVNVRAGSWVATALTSVWTNIGGQIYFDRGATIDVAGTGNVSLPLSRNFLLVQLRGAELANSPLQRNGPVRGASLMVDIRKQGTYDGQFWMGTPLGDVSGFVGVVERSVAELTTAGGSVSLSAGEAVILRPGSEIDVSGGWVRYEGGRVRTSRLLEKGRLVDVADATPDRVYDGIYTGLSSKVHEKWGITKTFQGALAPTGERMESSYLAGADAGSITIDASSVALDGNLIGRTIQGARQTSEDGSDPAGLATLALSFRTSDAIRPSFFTSPTPPKITFHPSDKLSEAAPFALDSSGASIPLRADRKDQVILSPKLLTEGGFWNLIVDNSDGDIRIPAGVEVEAPVEGSISLKGANIQVDGTVTVPGGSIEFIAYNISPFLGAKLRADSAARPPTPPPNLNRGRFVLGPSAVLNVAGRITDYRLQSASLDVSRPVLKGGLVDIRAYDVLLSEGSSIDASGGLTVSSGGNRNFGDGGEIKIFAGRDPDLTWLVGGKIQLGSDLRAYSGATGGALTLQAPLVQVGGTLPELVASKTGGDPVFLFGQTEVQKDELLHLSPDFFSRGGFTNFTIRALGKAVNAGLGQFLPAIDITPGTVIRPIAQTWRAKSRGDRIVLEPFQRPEGLRAPVSLQFETFVTQDIFDTIPKTVLRGDIILGAGARIETDPGASVSLKGGTVAVLGSIIAPGGSIAIEGARLFPAFEQSLPPPELNRALPTVHLAPGSVLSTAGRVVLTPDSFGRRIGKVLPGGTVTVSGNIVAEAGAVIDVSGASGVLDLPPEGLARSISTSNTGRSEPLVPVNSGLTGPLYSRAAVPTRVESDAGTIVLRGAQQLVTDATLRGFAGGPSASGGRLEISSGRYFDPTQTLSPSPLDINLLVTQSGRNIAGPFYPAGGTAIGRPVPLVRGNPDLGLGHFSVDAFAQGGFDYLKLSGTDTGAVSFTGPVSISARRGISVAEGGTLFADALVELSAPYVALGGAFVTPPQAGTGDLNDLSLPGQIGILPTSGIGRLVVRGSLIDLGNLSLQNISSASFIADGGDIRGNGALNVAGEIELRAGQVYPTTAGQFNVVAFDPNVRVISSATTSRSVRLASSSLPTGFTVGSPLLGSRVQQIAGDLVTLESNANTTITGETVLTFAPGAGSVVVTGSGTRPLPLSAGGTLSIYASNITQGGTLRAPFGSINLGWDGTGSSPIDYLSRAGITVGRSVPVAQNVRLVAGSVTSISAVDPRTGQGALIPFGFNSNENLWVDPSGADLLRSGLPARQVRVSGLSVDTQAGSSIDVQGGGELFSYRWVSGNGGSIDILGQATADWDSSASYTAGQLIRFAGRTWSARRASQGVRPSISLDWSLVPERFAVIPGYEVGYAPFAPFNDRANPSNQAISDPGYVGTGISVGDRIYLGASDGLPAGSYTLLPARYAILPGAVLVTPTTGSARRTFSLPDGSSRVSGYRFNGLNPGSASPAVAARFEISPFEITRTRAQYETYLAGEFLSRSVAELGIPLPRLPEDSGRVVLSGLQSLQVRGSIAGRSAVGGFGAEIDLSTADDILVVGAVGTGPSGTTVLDSALLSSFGADSLLIGGTRQTTEAGTRINVVSSNITVANSGTPLSVSEVLLASRNRLHFAAGSEIAQSGTTRAGIVQTPVPILIGDQAVAGSGNGLLFRASDTPTEVIRTNVSSQSAQAALATPPVLSIGAGSRFSGNAFLFDSTYGTSLDPSAILQGRDVALNSGQILVRFDNAGTVPTIAGLRLGGSALQSLQSAQKLSLQSYSTLDLYGSGVFRTAGSLSLQAGRFRAFNTGGGVIEFASSDLLIGNRKAGVGTAASSPGGRLVFTGETVRLGSGPVIVDGFDRVDIFSSAGFLADADGSLSVNGGLLISTPVVTAGTVSYAVSATGDLSLVRPATATRIAVSPGLGASLSFTGRSLSLETDVLLPSGQLGLRALAGDLTVGTLSPALIDVGGISRRFNDLVRATNGGTVTLAADAGSVTLGSLSRISVAASPSGGNAGRVAIQTPTGGFVLAGALDGRGGSGGESGSFELDVAALPVVTAVDQILNTGGFLQSRTYRVRTGNVRVDSLARALTYRLSADQGSITVAPTGTIDASGIYGGRIDLVASGSVILESGARLSVAGGNFDSAGKGGRISLEAGSHRNGIINTSGYVDVQSGSLIDLSVASRTPTSASLGRFTGTLHLRAPRIGTNGLQVNPINGTILNASSIIVEGYQLTDLTGSGTITAAVQNNIRTSGLAFGANIGALSIALLANNSGLESAFVIVPGAELINRTGDLILGTSGSTTTSDWNLAGFRFGPKQAPGVLTLRAAGNLVFFNALSDGFTPTLGNTDAAWLYRAELTPFNAALPTNAQSWSYRMAAGADFGSTAFQVVRPFSALAANAGSLQLGKLVTTNNGNPVATGNANAVSTAALANRYQVIRTGSGNIEIHAARDVQFLNPFATIYTAGTRVADPTLGGTFEIPPSSFIGSQGALGAVQQSPTYAAQYSLGGGNVLIRAGVDIKRQTQTGGVLVDDSQKQIPNNWLYRRGYIDPATGRFGVTRDGDIASTSWWIDFSNFFQGVGALGGGNVTLLAGNDVRNVDAVTPTNARLTYRTASGDRTPANQTLVELGGGDVRVVAGRNIDAGIYYVERGQGVLVAGGSILTNRTRSASLGSLDPISATNPNPSPAQWLPTTLFLGKGTFDVLAGKDITLGPTVNPFLLPIGINNSFWRKSYFSTYAPESAVQVTSLGGNITLRQNSTAPGVEDDAPILQNWMETIHLLSTNPRSLSLVQPWLRIGETQLTPFATVFTILPPSLRATTFVGDVNLVGDFNLSPAARSTFELVAGGSVNGLQPTGIVSLPSAGNIPQTIWRAATVNLSDASPDALPRVRSPFGYQSRVGLVGANAQRTASNFLLSVDSLFRESGSSSGVQAVIQTQQALHGTSLLRAGDAQPARIYAIGGSISGLTFFSGKFARIVARRDLSDVSLYLQNNSTSDVSVVSAGGDIIPYNANSILRTRAQAIGNRLNRAEVPMAGDIQINGPGTLAVLSGRNLDLGTGANNPDGTGVGISSIGNARNPNLPFAGADLIAAAGLGPASGLSGAIPGFGGFLGSFVSAPDADTLFAEMLLQNTNLPANLSLASLRNLSPDLQARVALELFFLTLRETGRAATGSGGGNPGGYERGFEAIAELFGLSSGRGDILTRSRDIRTRSGGSITLLAPGGGLTLTTTTIGTPLTPPGVITEAGGGISVFTKNDVNLGISRIFTLRGGNQVIWSSAGDIAAGSSSKTIQSAPPTRVLLDPQSAALTVDLAGLATGGGIGVLATVDGVKPGSVDLIAPGGTVDAGDAGIRASGNLNIAAVRILNSDNINVGGSTSGVPTAAPVAAPNVAGLTAASNTTGAATAAADTVAQQAQSGAATAPVLPSVITVEILGYGGETDGQD